MTKTKPFIPFSYCSIKRASNFLTEALGQSIEVEDIENMIEMGIIELCVYINSPNETLLISAEIRLQYNPIDLCNKNDVDDVKSKLQVKVKEFQDKYLDNELILIPNKWISDGSPSGIIPADTGYFEKNKIFQEFAYCIFEQEVNPMGIWGIGKNLLRYLKNNETIRYNETFFSRINMTEYRWLGQTRSETEIKYEDIRVNANDLKKIIDMKSSKTDHTIKYEVPSYYDPAPYDHHRLNIKTPRIETSQLDTLSALYHCLPDLKEKIEARKNIEEIPDILNKFLISKNLSPLKYPFVGKTFLSWLERANYDPTWKNN